MDKDKQIRIIEDDKHWENLRKKQRETEKKVEEIAPKCSRCQKPGHVARSCTQMKKPTDKE